MKIDIKKITEFVKKNKMTVISVSVLAFSILFIALFGKVTFQYDDDGFTVDAWFAKEIGISYDKVESVSISDVIDIGARKSGIETGRVYAGTFENGSYGVYTLYIYKSVSEYITVRHEGGTLVFNCGTEEGTDDAYYRIFSNMKPRE